MKTGTDGSNHEWIEVGDVRITLVSQTFDKGAPGIRIQMKKGVGESMFQGPEIPIPNKEFGFEFVQALFKAFEGIGL